MAPTRYQGRPGKWVSQNRSFNAHQRTGRVERPVFATQKTNNHQVMAPTRFQRSANRRVLGRRAYEPLQGTNGVSQKVDDQQILRKNLTGVEKKRVKRRGGTGSNTHFLSTPGKHITWDTWDLDIAVWNIEGKGTPEDIDKIIKTRKNVLPDVVLLQEANLPTDSKTTENFVWHCSGTSGSAVLVKKDLANVEVVSCESVCEQICVVEVKHEDVNIKLISCCIPPSTSYLCEDVWEKLINVLKAIPSSMTYVLAGDFNAQIGKTDARNVTFGGFGNLALPNETSDENGLKLVDLVRNASLRVANTFKPFLSMDKSIEMLTYMDSPISSQRSYVMLPKHRNGISLHNHNSCWVPDYKHSIQQNNVKIIKSEKYMFGLLEKDLKSEKKMIVSTWNVHGASPAKVDTILTEQKLEVVCIQEMFVTSAEDLTTENFNWYSMAKPWAKNVAIVVKKSSDIKVERFEAISESLCVGDVVYKDKTVKVISCYLPLPKDPKNEALKSQLTELIKSIPKEDLYVLAGDFNLTSQEKNTSSNMVPEEKSSQEKTSPSKVAPQEESSQEKTTSSEVTPQKEPPQEKATTTEVNTEDCTDNSTFLANLVNETNLCMEQTLYNLWSKFKNNLITRIGPTHTICRPHQILMPKHFRLQKIIKMFTNWISFFDNAILSLFVDDLEVKPIDKNLGVKSVVLRMEENDGKLQHIKELNYFETDELNEENLISVEDREKFKNTPPSAEELGSLLKDFVLFHKPHDKVDLGPNIVSINMLVNSFRESGKHGKFLVEEIDSFKHPGQKRIGRECRIKWQGIVLAKTSGSADMEIHQLTKQCGEQLTAKLGQTCYTVKGKRAFFNKGFEPTLPKDQTLDDIFRMVSKKDYPTMAEVIAYIEEFLSTDTDCELAFGPEYTKEELDIIKKYAEEHKLGTRFFTSAKDQKENDHIAIFNRRTPQEIRDQVIENGDDPKYYVVRPCGIAEDYTKCVTQSDVSQSTKDSKVYTDFWNNISKDKEPQKNAANKEIKAAKPSAQPEKKVEPTKRKRQKKGPVVPKPQIASQQLANNRPAPSRFQERRRGNVSLIGRRQLQQRFEERHHNIQPWLSNSQDTYEDRYNERKRMMQSERERMQEDRYLNRDRMNQDGYGRQDNSFDNSQFLNARDKIFDNPQFQTARDNRFDNPQFQTAEVNNFEISQFQNARNKSFDISQFQTVRDNNFDNPQFQTARVNSFEISQFQNARDNSFDISQFQNARDNSFDISQFQNARDNSFYNSQFKNPSFDKEYRQPKRSKNDKPSNSLPQVSTPPWHLCAPLILVWPVTMQSHLEERHHIILEENFPTSYSKNEYGVAVMVTLPMRNGNQKEYCLSVGYDKKRATNEALELIIKHSTVIKPSPAYLCNGGAPNFVRYKVHCQTNPRTYIILTKNETGPLTQEKVHHLLQTFQESYNEDVFFDNYSFTFQEKTLLIEIAPKYQLKVRHFGDAPGVVNRWVCIYKKRPKEQILEEVLKMRGNHPKYMITTDRLPARMGLNIF